MQTFGTGPITHWRPRMTFEIFSRDHRLSLPAYGGILCSKLCGYYIDEINIAVGALEFTNPGGGVVIAIILLHAS